MAHPQKIVCIGAGSYSFGLTTLVSLLRSEVLKGSQLVLVDRHHRRPTLKGLPGCRHLGWCQRHRSGPATSL